jgi:hypothetical protein
MKLNIKPNCNPEAEKHVWDYVGRFDLVISSKSGAVTIYHRRMPICHSCAERILATDKRVSIWFQSEGDAMKAKRAMIEAELVWGHDIRGAGCGRHYNVVHIRRSLVRIYADV